MLAKIQAEDGNRKPDSCGSSLPGQGNAGQAPAKLAATSMRSTEYSQANLYQATSLCSWTRGLI
jgi:hypothetical protein